VDTILEFLQLDTFRPGDLLIVATLIVLEGCLSCDNAVALAMLVRRLPREQQGRALRYGILGAYTFLFVAILLATWIVSQWYLKLLGGAYLLWLAVEHFWHNQRDEAGEKVPRQPRRILGLNVFWSTVVTVELTDIAFSVDSIAAAVALSNKVWILWLGGMICILVMRFAAQGFVRLLHRFPHIEGAAFVAVAVIGLKLVIEFPADVVGRIVPIPATYATPSEYARLVEERRIPTVDLGHILAVNLDAAEPPLESAFATADDYREAKSYWTHHARAFVHLNEWAASGLILLIIASGFVPAKRRSTPLAS
jgi:YkoY family integral membrane protein